MIPADMLVAAVADLRTAYGPIRKRLTTTDRAMADAFLLAFVRVAKAAAADARETSDCASQVETLVGEVDQHAHDCRESAESALLSCDQANGFRGETLNYLEMSRAIVHHLGWCDGLDAEPDGDVLHNHVAALDVPKARRILSECEGFAAIAVEAQKKAEAAAELAESSGEGGFLAFESDPDAPCPPDPPGSYCLRCCTEPCRRAPRWTYVCPTCGGEGTVHRPDAPCPRCGGSLEDSERAEGGAAR